ncbi:unnamed protein product [Arabis nemorensis]|uniref:RING-type E3 ubiquitin transferase n=1 Tax=Arabis nemorensis TaxID=586526 RepID=A0A565BZE4_9BRAS|nr:unnamed protein product [Arabis nemorensis]
MVHWGGFACCLGAAALYLLSQRTGRDAEILKSVTRVCQLDYLAELLEAERPLIVGVWGRVGSETPIKSEHSGILGVIVEEEAEHHFLKRNWMFSWVQDCSLMQPMSKQVPWYLDDGTGRVNVAGTQGAIGFTLTVGSEVFEKPEPSSLVRGTLDYLRGLKMLGVRRIERVLPIGTPLTVVGEAVKDGIGDVRIRKPERGPFYISPIPLEQLISNLGKWSRRFKYAAIGLTILGVILISKPVIKYILGRIEYIIERTEYTLETRRRRLLQKKVVDAAAKRAETVSRELERLHGNSSDVTSRDGDAPDLCVICFDQKCNAAFVWSYVLLHNMLHEVAGEVLSSLPETNRSCFEDLPPLKTKLSLHIWTKPSDLLNPIHQQTILESLVCAAALYLLSRRTGRDPEILKSVTRVYHLKDLAKLLEAKRPSIIGVSGRVGSETPIKSDRSGILGVIVEETEDGTGRVNVAGAQGATGFALTVRNEVLEKPEPASLVLGTLDYLRGFKMLGVRRIEHVLPLGTQLTVVGKAVKDGIGDVRIQKTEQGPFYVSPVPLITSSVKWSRRFKHASMGLTLLGLFLISKTAIEYFLDAYAKREERVTQGLEFAVNIMSLSPGLKRKHETSSDGSDTDGDAPDLCVICLERKYNAAFVQGSLVRFAGHKLIMFRRSTAIEDKSQLHPLEVIGLNLPVC